MKRSSLKNLFSLFVALLIGASTSSIWAMGGTVPSGYPSSFMMGLVDDDYQDALNSYGQGTDAEVNTVNQYMQVTGGWDAVYRYLNGGLACTGTGWYSQYPGGGGSVGNFANLANNAGLQPIFIYYQIGAVYTNSLTSTSFMGEYYQDWEQFLIQINTWMTAHPGKVVTVDIEPDMFGTIQQGGGSSTYTVSVASATEPSCTTPWVSLSTFPNTIAGYCQALLYLKDQELSTTNQPNLKVAFHVSGWAVSPNPATTSGMGAAALSTQAGSIATFLNACQPTSGSKFDLFFTDPSGYDGGYQSAYNWDTGGAMAQQYANWLNDLTADVSLRCILWQMPEGNSKMNNVTGHYTDTRPEYFLNDSPLNSSGYTHNICLYVASGCIGVLWGPGDYHGTDVMDYFYPAQYAADSAQQDGSGNSGAGTWITPAVVDDDGGFFRTHIANNHTWGATCLLTGSSNTSTSTATSTRTSTQTSTQTSTNTATATATRTASKTSTATMTTTPTATVTFTSTVTMTNTIGTTNTQTASNTPSWTATVTSTDTPGANTATVTSTDSSTDTPGGNTATTTNTQTMTATASATSTATSTSTSAPSNTATATVTMSATSTFTSTSTATVTNTATGVLNTATSTGTSTVSSTQTSTVTVTDSQTSTSTWTATATSTMTDTPRPPNTATSTSTSTLTATVTYTNTVTQSPTQTFTKTVTPTPTATTVTRVICSNPYPNPVSSGQVKVDVTVPPGVSTIYMDVFTISLRKISEQSFKTTGVTTTILWNLQDRMGLPVADGLYYLRVRAVSGTSSPTILKVLVLK